MQHLLKCVECDRDADWIRSTQFAGDHPYCDKHARLESDWGQGDSYQYWVKIPNHTGMDSAGYELDTLANQQYFDKMRNIHYTNTNNPVDFPPADPKPELGRAAILSNIQYYQSKLQSLQLEAEGYIKEAQFWVNELDKLK